MLDRIINEVKNAIVAAVKGADDTITALRTTVKNQTTGVLKDAGDIGIAAEDAIAGVAEGAVRGLLVLWFRLPKQSRTRYTLLLRGPPRPV
jgi:hypothetical protein